MSATAIIDTAPLGALIRYSNGSPKPPARFTKKLAAWERSNVVGRVVKKEPPRPYPTWTAPASFTLYESDFSLDGVILVTIMRSASADSLLSFEVIEVPKARQVCVLLDLGTAPSFCIRRGPSRWRSFVLPRRTIAMRGYRSSAMGAGEMVIFASPNTLGHSPKARLVVTMTEVRSESWPPDYAKQISQFVRCPAMVCLQTTRGENDEAHVGQIIRHLALFAAYSPDR